MKSKFLYGHLDAMFYSLMVGAGEAFFAAFSLDLGFSELEASILVTAPIFIGGILQLTAPYGINLLKSYKNWTMIGVAIQAFIFLILVILRPTIASNYTILFILVSLYWSMSLGVGPSWNSWVSGFLKTNEIRPYFSERSIYSAIGTLTGLLLTGLVLQYLPKNIFGQDRYDLIFIACFIFRSISLFALSKYPRVEFKEIKHVIEPKPPENFFLKKFIFYSCVFKIGVFFCASFFAPYMLKQLNFSYIEFTAILLSPFVGRVIFNRAFRKTLENFNINNVYLFSSIAISIIPLLWIELNSFIWLFMMEIITGMVWGAFEVSFNITCFEKIPTEKQSIVMAKYNFLHTICIGIGSISGLYVFSLLGPNLNTYYFMFGGSFFLRLLSLCFFPLKEIESSQIEATLISRPMAVRPNMGIITRPVWRVLKKVKRKK